MRLIDADELDFWYRKNKKGYPAWEDGYITKPEIYAAPAIDAVPLTERIKELITADEEERCVVLPCKVGTPVYCVRVERVPDDDYRMSWHTEMSVVEMSFNVIQYNCIGKTVFLTREEAEAALKKLDEKDGE